MPAERDDLVLPTVHELLERVGVRSGATAQELPHNRRLTPGVWRVAVDGTPTVVKYLRADRDPGVTPWDAHWTASDHDPRRWNYWAREPLAYQHHLTDVYARGGIGAPRCLGVHVDDQEAVLVLQWVDG